MRVVNAESQVVLQLDGQDHGIWRRIKLIPFNVIFGEDSCSEGPTKDPKLLLKLRQEFPGVLRWAVDGCLLWQNEGLGASETVSTATLSYQDAMGKLGGFIADRCVTSPDLKVTAKTLYAAYKSWCEENGEKAESQRTVGMRLGERAIYHQKRGGQGRWYWHGLGLITDKMAQGADN